MPGWMTQCWKILSKSAVGDWTIDHPARTTLGLELGCEVAGILHVAVSLDYWSAIPIGIPAGLLAARTIHSLLRLCRPRGPDRKTHV